MTLEQALEFAAKDLPPRWDIEIKIERGAATLVLLDENCDEVLDDRFAAPDSKLADRIQACVKYAKYAAESAAPPK